MRLGYGLAVGAMAAGLCAASSAQASLQMLTVDFNQYASAVDTTPGEVLATMTVKDLATGGVSVDVTLDDAIYFASTGGPHITFAFNLGKVISFNDFTFTNPSKSNFNFVLNTTPSPHLAPLPMALTARGLGLATISLAPSISPLLICRCQILRKTPTAIGGSWMFLALTAPGRPGAISA
jgi:hypothetical protein